MRDVERLTNGMARQIKRNMVLEAILREMMDEALRVGVGKGANVFNDRIWKRALAVLEASRDE